MGRLRRCEQHCNKHRNLGGKIEGIDEDSVEFAIGAVVCEWYGSICDIGGEQDLLRVLQVGKDVVSVATLFAEARCQNFFWYFFC